MRGQNTWKGIAAGMVGGLAATFVMTGFQTAWSKASQALSEEEDEQKNQDSESENSTATVATRIANIAGYELSREQKQKGGMIVHYAFGTLMGGLYGMIQENTSRRTRQRPVRSGLEFGSALFAGADEVVLPALALADGTTSAPLSAHAYGLVSHMVYGATMGIVSKAARNAMG